MRLFSRTGAAAVDDGGVHYEPGEDDGFDFPHEFGEHLHSFHSGGKPMWETYGERQSRLVAAELARLNDPATLPLLAAQVMEAAGHGDPAASVVAQAGDQPPQ